MSYSNLEILSGILVAACLLLLYCNYSKPCPENMHGERYIPGLNMRQGMYSDLPKAGTFQSRDGYTVGRVNNPALSYTTRTSYFQENMNSGLNDKVVRPAVADLQRPKCNETGMLWVPDAAIPLNVYVGGELNSQKFSEEDEKFILKNIFNRKVNQNSVQGPGSVCGTALKYVDFGGNMQPTRNITM